MRNEDWGDRNEVKGKHRKMMEFIIKKLKAAIEKLVECDEPWNVKNKVHLRKKRYLVYVIVKLHKLWNTLLSTLFFELQNRVGGEICQKTNGLGQERSELGKMQRVWLKYESSVKVWLGNGGAEVWTGNSCMIWVLFHCHFGFYLHNAKRYAMSFL